jgi:protein phosphatase 1 regulatory subunit 7
VLDFSNNQVSHLEHLSSLKNLEELWGSNNQLASFEEVERELKDKEKLETVYFEGNPLQLNGPAVYRNKVRLALPNIRQIDASKCFLVLSMSCSMHMVSDMVLMILYSVCPSLRE